MKNEGEKTILDGSNFIQVQCGKAMSLPFLVTQGVFESKIYVALCF